MQNCVAPLLPVCVLLSVAFLLYACVLVDVFRARVVVHSVPNSRQSPREECGLRYADK